MSIPGVSRNPSRVGKVITNTKGKWDKKKGRPRDAGNKENAALYKNFNTVDRGQGF